MSESRTKLLILSFFIFYFVFLLPGCTTAKKTKLTEHIIHWEDLSNPVFQTNEELITGIDAAYDNGTWYLFYSTIYEDNSGTHSRIVEVSTTDFKEFSAPILYFNGQEDGWLGMANPNITKHRNIYYLSFNSWGDKPGKPNQLFYMTSRDLNNWTMKTPLAPELTANEKATHAALAFDRGKWFLIYNSQKETQIAIARGVRSHFEKLGIGTPSFYSSTDSVVAHQKHQFIQFGNKWGLLASGNVNHPFLYMLKNQSTTGLNWLTWEGGYPLQVASQEFASDQEIECASLINLQQFDGYFYLFCLLNPDDETTQERGSNKISVYRSSDLINWMPAGR